MGGPACWLAGWEGCGAKEATSAPQVSQPPEADRLSAGLTVPQLLPCGASLSLTPAPATGPAEVRLSPVQLPRLTANGVKAQSPGA